MTDRHMTICHDITAFMHSHNVSPKRNVYMYELHKRPLNSLMDIFGIPFAKECEYENTSDKIQSYCHMVKT